MSLLADVRFGFRSLRKNPGFTAVAVATLALGIGVNATVFTVTNAVLFKGFPMVEGNDRLPIHQQRWLLHLVSRF